ncbi:type II toxin-antitoxin system VapB family antitoxin [Endozoicomonas sp. GU-1]|uniref:type II toxin-antitoxin system VapB family antitoxin n=1 Tax=Endozoicomonas sp. GU-1 TaxID=3009078 RepID=UPI0022B4928B|nr:type II toxin-antitoxin system VapB family antitoxin [Endozoicomonas sp. GU-1]WBA82907.1 type II toxin-antitoxin system VapB family antitoxin [Endozoicomonas sp. GU-1]WBA85834.1 type II toxin-antitoxin system VapB family antitoxin [Endozoicomonas sp. GU-1]
MPSNLAIDDDLIAQVQQLGGFKTKKAAVNEALAEFIRHRKQLELLDDFGTIDYHDDQASKKEARRK